MNSLAKTVLTLLLLIAAHPSQADDVADGVAAMRTGDFTGASTAWATMAAIGNPAGVNNLAYLYLVGQGVERDVTKAVDLLTAASNFGYPLSQYNLGFVLANAATYGVEMAGAQTRATDLYRAAAYGGHTRAQYLLAVRTFLGNGADKDMVEALAWLAVARDKAEPTLVVHIDPLIRAAASQMTPAQLGEASVHAKRLRNDVRQVATTSELARAVAPQTVAELR